MPTEADRIFKAFCIFCWVVWLAVGMLVIIGLLLSNKEAGLIQKGEVLGLFIITTYFCIGLPAAIKLLFIVVERYQSKTRTEES